MPIISYQLDIQTLAILAGLIGFGFLYFGKLITSAQPNKFDKIETYITGLFFFIRFLFIPFVIIMIVNFALKESVYKLKMEFPPDIAAIVLFIILIFYILSVRAWIKYLESNLKGKLGKFNNFLFKLFGNRFINFGFALLTLVSLLSIFKLTNNLFFIAYLIFVFFIFTIMAVSVGHMKTSFDPVRIVLENKMEFKGKFLKERDEYLYLLNKNKIFAINKNKIISIEFES